jgi:hypothetical protein
MKPRSYFAILLVFTLVICGSFFVHGQGTDLGTIRGTVTDSSGAVVVNASVTVLDVRTGATREIKTNSHGEYQMFGLPSGQYKVTIVAAGMATQDITGIVLNGSDVATADARLKVSSANQEIVVTAEAPTIDDSNQTISNTINSTEVINLPRDSRDVYDFLYLNPNITQADNPGELKLLGFQSYGANFTIDGQRSTNTIFGSHMSSEPSLEAVSEVNVLSNDFSAEYAGVANIRITTKRGEDQFHGSAFYNNKNSSLAALQVQDKIGILGSQGSLYPFPYPYFNFNDIGGSLGGPIKGLNKTWFFMAYERNYTRAPVSFTDSHLPHPTFWTGDFSLLTSSPAQLPDVPAGIALTPAEVANDTYLSLGQQFVTIPSRLLDPNVQKMISLYFPKIDPSIALSPSRGGRLGDTFQTTLPGGSTRDLGTFRVDHDLTDKDHVYVVYNAQAFVGDQSPVRSPFTGLGLTQNDIRDNTLSGSYVRMIRNNIINEARGGFNRENRYVHSNTTLQSFLSSIGFDQNAIDAYGAVVGQNILATHGHPVITWAGSNYTSFDRSGDRATDRLLGQYLTTFGDTLTWVIGTHNLKVGADFVRNVGQDGFAVGRGNPRGLMKYVNPTACQTNGTPTPCVGGRAGAFADWLLGLPASTVQFIPKTRPPMDVHNWEQGYFFQDDWKATPNLTFNLGLRYELVSPFIDKNDIMMNFDPTFNNSTGRLIVASNKTLQYLDSRLLSLLPIVTASQSGLGVGRGVLRTDKNNFSPRVGAALRLGDRSVVRGGYGIYFPTAAAQGIRDPLSTNGFNQAQSKATDPNDPNATALQPWPTPMTGGSIVPNTDFVSINAVPVGLQQPRVQQYNVTFERELGLKTSARISYLGITSHGLIAGRDLNGIAPSNAGWNTTTGDGVTPCSVDDGDCLLSAADLARIPYPALGDFLTSFGNYGHGQSNSFQGQLERRYSSGFMFNASYTYADQKSTGIDLANSSLGGVAYDPFNPERDYTQDSWVSRHRFVLYGVYDLPVGRGRKLGSGMSNWADAVIGGWQTSFQMFAKSGTAFTPYLACDNCFNNQRYIGPGNTATGSIDAVGDFTGGYRPLIVGNYKQPVGDQLFNPAAFAPPPMGADLFTSPGVARKNLLWGPGAWGVNFGLHKEFRFGERVTASLGADVNNLFNHPIRMPNLDFADGSFAFVGDFDVQVDPNTLRPQLEDFIPNDDPLTGFGRIHQTFSQEGVDGRRTVRLRLRIAF